MSYLYENLTYRLRGIFFKVYNTLGPGFSKIIYHRAICKELNKAGLTYEVEKSATIQYNEEPIGRQRLDLVIDGKIAIEVKATEHHLPLFDRQALSYLKGAGLALGFLVNFGGPKLIIKRFISQNQSNHE